MSEKDCDEQTMPLEALASSAPIDTCKKEAMQTACQKDITESPWDPSNLVITHESNDIEKIYELWKQKCSQMAKALPNDIMIPDRTPKFVQNAFYDISPKLEPVLKKDSVRCFLRLFSISPRGMSWHSSITSQTLTCIVRHNALRCAKVVLEGKMPQLYCMHANPNCINPHGYFPLHEAAERFSVDMIKLLFRHGASANVRTVGDDVIEDLLPLHVAVENACMHKYLEDNLSPTQYHRDHIYKLVHLLCLPEMKIFLDTIRILAEKTDNLVDELWYYIKERKLVQSSLLLLAAQKQIRKHDWFNIIMYRIFKECAALRFETGDNDEARSARNQLEEIFHFVSIISHAGEALDKYIRAHSEVPHVDVLEHVSSILEEFGFSPKRDCIDIRTSALITARFIGGYMTKNTSPDYFSWTLGLMRATEELTEMPYLSAADEKVLRKNVTGGWDPTYKRRHFFPLGRSVLGARCNVRVYSSYATPDDEMVLDLEQLRKRMSDESSVPNYIGLVGKFQQLISTYQPRKYSTHALKTLAMVLKNA